MRFKHLSVLLAKQSQKYVSKTDLAVELGVERRKLDSLLAETPGAVTYEEGKVVEDFLRAKYVAERKTVAPQSMFVVTAGIPYRTAPDTVDWFAVAYWPEEGLMVAKSVGGPQLGSLPNRDAETRAMLAQQSFQALGLKVNLKNIRYYEVQNTKMLNIAAPISGLRNDMTVHDAKYEQTDQQTQAEILLRADWF